LERIETGLSSEEQLRIIEDWKATLPPKPSARRPQYEEATVIGAVGFPLALMGGMCGFLIFLATVMYSDFLNPLVGLMSIFVLGVAGAISPVVLVYTQNVYRLFAHKRALRTSGWNDYIVSYKAWFVACAPSFVQYAHPDNIVIAGWVASIRAEIKTFS